MPTVVGQLLHQLQYIMYLACISAAGASVYIIHVGHMQLLQRMVHIIILGGFLC